MDGATFEPIAIGLANTGSYTWRVPNRPTLQAIVRVQATDNLFVNGHDDSDAPFTIESPPGGLAPTTLRDFDQPGTQPLEAGVLNPPEACSFCHGFYNPEVEPYFNWQGSMMAQASIDPLFTACLAVANQDAPDSGDICIRCHIPRGWYQGRSVPTDGSAIEADDLRGVSCDFCHRMVDPIYDPLMNPAEDEAILTRLRFPGPVFANSMAVLDPNGTRRGPFVDAFTGHPILVSPFHREAAICGTCHNVSNPVFERDGNGNYVPNAMDAAASDFSAHNLGPVERTYSEWLFSAYNTPEGVYAPEFGGNRDYVATCQDCHMRDITGEGCAFGSPPVRDDLPLHDMTGGSTWLPGVLATAYPFQVDASALQAGVQRARHLLQHAAVMTLAQEGVRLKVTITNETGHKLPTGYPEGRRMWINVKFYTAGKTLVGESGAYNADTGVLTEDPAVKVYEAKPGLDETTAPLVGLEPGASFHFVLNNRFFKDNRIPPRGFTNEAYEAFGGQPIGHTYEDGQYWDDTHYDIPAGATSAEVTLYYQSTSKAFIEFLRDENFTDGTGQALYDLWNDNGKCPPEVMQTNTIALLNCTTDADCDDGLYCNGAETCDLALGCLPGSDPCESDPLPFCAEDLDACVACLTSDHCDDGDPCNGPEVCTDAHICSGGTFVDCNGNGIADMCDAVTEGDFNADGAIDLLDFAAFALCSGGPGAAPPFTYPECADMCLTAFDIDADTDIDFADFSLLVDDFAAE